VADDLARDHQVIVPDRLGYGRTAGRAAGFAANANALAKLLGTLGLEGALIVGHSWAGGVALEMALDFPHSVTGLGLISSVAPGAPIARLDRLLALPVIGTSLVAVALSTGGRVLLWWPGRVFAGRRLRDLSPDQLSELARSWRRRSTWNSFTIEQRALVHELPCLAPRLASIGVPTLVVVGTTDRVVPPAAGRRLAADIPGSVLEMVHGGHLLPQLQPAQVAAAVRRLAARSS
jgi:pimeloyl-ACP methyl ester carboxylesterase